MVAVLTVLTLLFLTGLFERLPEATLSAVVIAAVIELVDIASLRRLYRVWTTRLGSIYGFAARADFAAAMPMNSPGRVSKISTPSSAASAARKSAIAAQP